MNRPYNYNLSFKTQIVFILQIINKNDIISNQICCHSSTKPSAPTRSQRAKGP